MNKILAAAVVLSFVGVFWYIFSDSSPSRNLMASDFVSQYKKTSDAVLVDVRTPEEFRAGHIEGAVNIDFENTSFQTEIQKLDTTKSYFVYCRSGNRSGQALSVMDKVGMKNTYELKGGIVSNKNALTLVTF